MQPIGKKSILTATPPVLFMGAAYFAGATRLLHAFSGTTKKELLRAAGFSSFTFLGGSWISHNKEDPLRRVYSISFLALSAIVYPKLSQSLIGRIDFTYAASFLLFLVEGTLYAGVEFFLFRTKDRKRDFSELPKELITHILRELNDDDLITSGSVCMQWERVILDTEDLRKRAVPNVFGKKEWEAILKQDVGELPPLPSGIMPILNLPHQWYDTTHTLRETQTFYLVPKEINGKMYTIGDLLNYIDRPESSIYHERDHLIKEDVKQEKISPKHSYWFLAQKDYYYKAPNFFYFEKTRFSIIEFLVMSAISKEIIDRGCPMDTYDFETSRRGNVFFIGNGRPGTLYITFPSNKLYDSCRTPSEIKERYDGQSGVKRYY